MKTLTFLLALGNITQLFSQTDTLLKINQVDLITFWKADSLFGAGEYEKALIYYKSFEPDDYFNRNWPVKKALCYLINDDSISAKNYFKEYVFKGGHYQVSQNISSIPMIEKIAPDKKVLDQFFDNTIKFERGDSVCMYPKVKEQLRLMRIEDQRYRNGEGGEGSVTISDSINQVILKQLIDEYGWLGYKEVGTSGENASFLVIQHADLNVDFQQECLPMLYRALYEYNISPQSFAMLYDRIKVNSSEAQLFGSQVEQDSTKTKFVPKQLLNENLVNAYRLYVGLSTVEEYLEFMDNR